MPAPIPAMPDIVTSHRVDVIANTDDTAFIGVCTEQGCLWRTHISRNVAAVCDVATKHSLANLTAIERHRKAS